MHRRSADGKPADRKSPASGTTKTPQVATSVQLGWSPVTGADVYNLVLVRGATRIDRWTKSSQFEVRQRSQRTQVREVTRWYVYALFRTGGDGYRFGGLVAHGTMPLESDARFR